MMKTKLMGALVAMFLVGCGVEESSPLSETSQALAAERSMRGLCADVEQVVNAVRDGLGSCTPTFENQEPLAFSRAVCDAQVSTACHPSDKVYARRYVECLSAVAPCDPAQQEVFDTAIDDCLDTFQNSGANLECVELLIGD